MFLFAVANDSVANSATSSSPSSAASSSSGSTSSGSQPSVSRHRSKSKAGPIAGGVVGGVVVLAIIGLALWFFGIRRKKNRAISPSEPYYDDTTGPAEKDGIARNPERNEAPGQMAGNLGVSEVAATAADKKGRAATPPEPHHDDTTTPAEKDGNPHSPERNEVAGQLAGNLGVSEVAADDIPRREEKNLKTAAIPPSELP